MDRTANQGIKIEGKSQMEDHRATNGLPPRSSATRRFPSTGRTRSPLCTPRWCSVLRHLYARIRPGTDAALLNTMINYVIVHKLYDVDQRHPRCIRSSSTSLRSLVMPYK